MSWQLLLLILNRPEHSCWEKLTNYVRIRLLLTAVGSVGVA